MGRLIDFSSRINFTMRDTRALYLRFVENLRRRRKVTEKQSNRPTKST